MHELDDLVDRPSLGRRLGTSPNGVFNWTMRYDDFPKPLVSFGNTHVYSWDQIRLWYISHYGMKKFNTTPAGVDERGSRP